MDRPKDYFGATIGHPPLIHKAVPTPASDACFIRLALAGRMVVDQNKARSIDKNRATENFHRPAIDGVHGTDRYNL